MNITDFTCYVSALEARGEIDGGGGLKFENPYCNSFSHIIFYCRCTVPKRVLRKLAGSLCRKFPRELRIASFHFYYTCTLTTDHPSPPPAFHSHELYQPLSPSHCFLCVRGTLIFKPPVKLNYQHLKLYFGLFSKKSLNPLGSPGPFQFCHLDCRPGVTELTQLCDFVHRKCVFMSGIKGGFYFYGGFETV